MFTFDRDALTQRLRADLPMISEENTQLANKINIEEIASLAILIQHAKKIFVIGAGRTGLMMKAVAMRLMHLGLNVHVVGETTTPAIQEGDLLIAASGSGTTSSIVKAAEKANGVNAQVIAISTTNDSPLAKVSTLVVLIPAAQKQDFHGAISHQYAGSLFEQSVLFVGDAVFHAIWQLSNIPAEIMWKQHANME